MADPTDHIGKYLLGRIGPYWHSVSGLVLFVAVTFTFSYLGLVFFNGGQFDDAMTLLPSLLVPICAVLVWRLEHRLPRVPNGKVGIILSISAEDDQEAKRVQSDFTKELARRLRTGRLRESFVLIPLPQYLIDRLETDPAETSKLITRLRGHFFLKGYSKRRIVEGVEYHLVKTESMVRHAAIPKAVSQEFAKDMSAHLPADIRVAIDGDAIAFEATATQIGLGARYSIAVAAGLSGALTYSEELLNEVEQELSAISPAPATLDALSRAVDNRLKSILLRIILILSETYFLKRDKNILVATEPYCQKMLQRDPGCYVAKLQQAIICFVLRRDLISSRALLDRCRGEKDNTYRYGQAFLLGYEGKLQEAHEAYRAAFRHPLKQDNVPLQSEEFINIVIDEEPDCGHLHFCTGLINYNAKQDYLTAMGDFRQFLAIPTIDRFPWAKVKALELVGYCQRYVID